MSATTRTRSMSNSPSHRFWICDYNGFRRATATTLPAARKLARILCQYDAPGLGMPMQLCYSIHRQHYIVNFRDKRGYPGMRYSITGQWISARRVA